MIEDTVCWRRIDLPGHDTCRLVQLDDGWRLDGVAVFLQDSQPSRLAYCLTCDQHWRAREGMVSGWVGGRDCELRITRTADGLWTFNDDRMPTLEGCLDLDFSFTPATNLSQLRRAALEIGQGADFSVAWLDMTAVSLSILEHRYQRRTMNAYWYEAPRFNYAAELETRPPGFIQRYPGLWEEEHARHRDR